MLGRIVVALVLLSGGTPCIEFGCVQAGAATTQPKAGTRFGGGPYDGLTVDEFVDKSGKHVMAFLPPAPNSSPPPAELIDATQAIISASLSGDKTLYSKYIMAGAQAYFDCPGECPNHHPFDGFPFINKAFVAAGPPYMMSPGEGWARPANDKSAGISPTVGVTTYHCKPSVCDGDVRVEWLYKGHVIMLSFLHFTGGKMARVSNMVAKVPIVAIDPWPQDHSD